MTVYEMVTALFNDKEFKQGGCPNNERELLDAVGFEYTVSKGSVKDAGEDANALYDAVETIIRLSEKYDN